MTQRIGTNASVAEVLVRVEQEVSSNRRGDLGEAKARLGANQAKSAEVRGELKRLRSEADALATAARNVEQPHTFFGKLFHGRSAAREAENKAHAAEQKSLEAEAKKVELGERQRAQKEALEKMQSELQAATSASSDLGRMLREHVEHQERLAGS